MSELTSLIKLIKSSDGSHTLYRTDLNEHYHSVHGAKQESKHVFINAGLRDFINHSKSNKISILEIGFGTGLNALMSADFIDEKDNIIIEYTALEPFPLSIEIIDQLNYTESKKEKVIFSAIHTTYLKEFKKVSDRFLLKKLNQKIQDFATEFMYDLIYYDSFGPNTQEEMWKLEIFKKLYNLTKPNGRLVTYCAKGQVRRDLQKAGYKIERLKGPIGKREMLRAIKD